METFCSEEGQSEERPSVTNLDKELEQVKQSDEERKELMSADFGPGSTISSGTKTLSSPAFVAGFTDCAAEAVRFLVEEEQLSQESDVILRLKQHLLHQAAVKDEEDCGDSCVTEEGDQMEGWDDKEEEETTDTSSLSIDSAANLSSTSTDSGVDTAIEVASHCSPLSPRLLDNLPPRPHTPTPEEVILPAPHTSTPGETTLPAPQASTPGETILPAPHTPGEAPVELGTVSPCSPSSAAVAEFIQGLASVSRNNPTVAALAQELFQLLEEEN